MPVIKVAFVWHMHQPWYLWPDSREAALPFARLHGYSAYTDMPWVLRQYEATKVTFNLTPSLTAQIVGYARGDITDRPLTLCMRPAEDLDTDDRIYLLKHFSAGHPDRLSEMHTEYRRLLHKRGLVRNDAALEAVQREFTVQEMRDLQVWMNLACCGYALLRENLTIRDLWAKGKGFTEDEKFALLAELQHVLEVLPSLYRSAQEEGRAELSVSPYYHPILPLLCDMRDATRRISRDDLPGELWQAREDASFHIERAIDHHQALFNRPPRGVWPPEGAVSDATVALLGQFRLLWTASDEQILLQSLRPGATGRPTPSELYRPYGVGNTDLAMVFRDRELSDRIGFVYRAWRPEEAVSDFLGYLKRISEILPHSNRPPLVCVILDGENPWGAYFDRGETFLRKLYAAIEREKAVETTSLADYVAEFPASDELPSVFPGSWIDYSYRTWIGGAEHRRAWSLLTRARQAVKQAERHLPTDGTSKTDLARANEHILCAEGSDWFWWYSEYHHDQYEPVFDALFRANIAAVYSALGLDEPKEIAEPITTVTFGWLVRQPVGYMRATIDGRVTSYFEWQPAGLLRTSSLASAMHRSDAIVREVYFGFDDTALYMRVDTAGPADKALADGAVSLLFPGSPDRMLTLRPASEPAGTTELTGDLAGAAEGAIDAIVEVRVDRAAVIQADGNFLAFSLTVESNGQSVERWPLTGFVRVEVPTGDTLASTWIV